MRLRRLLPVLILLTAQTAVPGGDILEKVSSSYSEVLNWFFWVFLVVIFPTMLLFAILREVTSVFRRGR